MGLLPICRTPLFSRGFEFILTSNKKGPTRGPFVLVAEREGLIRIALWRYSPLRGALRASKTLARFVEQGSHPQPSTGKKKGPDGPLLFTGGERGIRTLGTL